MRTGAPEGPPLKLELEFAPDDVAGCLVALEEILESTLPGVRSFASLYGMSDLGEFRRHGDRGLSRDDRPARRRRRIPERWGLASVDADATFGSFFAAWMPDHPATSASWHASILWHTDRSGVATGSPTGIRVWMRVTIQGRVDELTTDPSVRSEFVETIDRAVRVAPAMFGYVSVSDFPDDPRRALNQYRLEDGPNGAFGYSWITWLPPSTAHTVGETPTPPVVDVLEVHDGSGGRVVAADAPPMYMSETDLRRFRDWMMPALLSERRESTLWHRRDLVRPAGILPEDWIPGDD